MPGVTYLENLFDVLVHGHHITVALGRELGIAPGAAAVAATRVWTNECLLAAVKELGALR